MAINLVEGSVLKSHYDRILEKARNITILQSSSELLRWDMETKMPPKGITLRSEQLALLRSLEHKMSGDAEIGVLLESIQTHPDYEGLTAIQRRNVYLIRKNYEEQTSLPEELVSETARQQAITIETWKRAKEVKDFSVFRPELEKLLALKKRSAEILMDVKETVNPYDALIDIYEPKMTSRKITKIFDGLRRDLISILDKCRTVNDRPSRSLLKREIPVETQRRISESLAMFTGYDIASKKARGRIDETEHPFTTGYYDDVRITTHYYRDNYITSLFSVLHEVGHALYEQNLNADWIYQPVGAACSMGLHESQSRLIENIIGRSREFWTYFFPKLRDISWKTFSDVDLDDFIAAINVVEPSKIRVRADEVTYCLHIIIRFEIERGLMNDAITVAELPEVWNQKYLDYLDMEIDDNTEGVMQDTHWASGYIGYFPTYALGNIYSGQILYQMMKDIPDWRDQVTGGNLHNVKQWLIDNVYSYGNLYDPAVLIQKVTGEEINMKHYINYLSEKYSKLYGF